MRMAEDLLFQQACEHIGYGRWEDATLFATDGSQTVTLPCSMFPAAAATAEQIYAARKWIHPTMFADRPYVPFSDTSPTQVIICPTRVGLQVK
jgi:hypothetical protein